MHARFAAGLATVSAILILCHANTVSASLPSGPGGALAPVSVDSGTFVVAQAKSKARKAKRTKPKAHKRKNIGTKAITPEPERPKVTNPKAINSEPLPKVANPKAINSEPLPANPKAVEVPNLKKSK